MDIFCAGKNKPVYCQYHQLTEDERCYINEETNTLYENFKKIVSFNRNLSLYNANDWAEGKIFYGYDAIYYGLVDEIGTYLDAENKLLELISKCNPGIRYTRIIDSN